MSGELRRHGKRVLLAGLLAVGCFDDGTSSEVVSSPATSKVTSIAELKSKLGSARPGDVIIVANGSYSTSSDTVITRAGTAAAPIVVAAETVGGVVITGSHGISFGSGAAFAQVRGFKFRNAAGTLKMPTGTHHCRYTRNTFELDGEGSYLSVSGDDHEVDHNVFQNKSTMGQMLTIQGPGSDGMAQRTWVHHNHFDNFMAGTGNNFETIRVGLSSRSLTDAHSLVEHNLFSACNGENEIISNKSGANTYRFNTIRDSRGSLTLRHGNRCLVYGNYLVNTEGIRFFGDGHKIYGNHLVGNSPAIQIGNGDGEVADGAAKTSHDRPDGCEVSFNTLIDNESNLEMSGRTGGLGSTNTVIANNIIQGGGSAASIRGPFPGATWKGNILWQSSAGDMPSSGFKSVNPRLVKDARGEQHLQPGSPAIDAASGSSPSPALDMDGQPRGGDPDVGADEVSDAKVVGRLLGDGDVGPGADDDAPPPPEKGDMGGQSGQGNAGGGGGITFEAEGVSFTDSGTGTSVDSDELASGGHWVSLGAENTGSWVEFTTPAVPAGSYTLALRWKGNANRGVATVRVDGVALGEPLDQFSADQSYPTSAMGAVTFAAAGTHLVRLQVTAQNAGSSGFVLSADQFTFTPK
jgi:poly(beta-D-mannuronate) lyase